MEAATAVRPAPPAVVWRAKLSDGSIAYNVFVTLPGTKHWAFLAATDEQHALRLRDEINGCAWVELA